MTCYCEPQSVVVHFLCWDLDRVPEDNMQSTHGRGHEASGSGRETFVGVDHAAYTTVIRLTRPVCLIWGLGVYLYYIRNHFCMIG